MHYSNVVWHNRHFGWQWYLVLLQLYPVGHRACLHGYCSIYSLAWNLWVWCSAKHVQCTWRSCVWLCICIIDSECSAVLIISALFPFFTPCAWCSSEYHQQLSVETFELDLVEEEKLHQIAVSSIIVIWLEGPWSYPPLSDLWQWYPSLSPWLPLQGDFPSGWRHLRLNEGM